MASPYEGDPAELLHRDRIEFEHPTVGRVLRRVSRSREKTSRSWCMASRHEHASRVVILHGRAAAMDMLLAATVTMIVRVPPVESAPYTLRKVIVGT